ncbi:MAG: hypothetical protein AABY78_06400 [Nitrospirota bacterium]
MIFGGIVGLIVYNVIEQAGGVPPVPENAPEPIKIMAVIFQNLDLLSFLQIVLAIFMLIAGIQFLRLRAWARTALEVICWIGLIFSVGFGIFWVASWASITPDLPVAEGTLRQTKIINIIGMLMGIIVIVVWVVPIIVITKVLRGKTIREAVF